MDGRGEGKWREWAWHVWEWLTHISQMMAQRLTKQMNGASETNELLGNTVQSAIRAAQQALYDLEHPRSPGSVKSIEVQRQQVKERAFYQSFLEKLGAMG